MATDRPSPQEQAKRLRAAMTRFDKSRSDLVRAGVGKSALSRILGKGDRGIGGPLASRLGAALRLSPDFFLRVQPMTIEQAMLPPPGSAPVLARLENVVVPPRMDSAALDIRERLITIARALGRTDLLYAVLDLSPPTVTEARDPVWWLDGFARAAASANKTPATPTPTPMPASDVVPRRAAK